MNNSADDRQEFEKLLALHLGDGLADDQHIQLDRILGRNPEYIPEYISQTNLDEMLRLELNESGSRSFLDSLVSKAESTELDSTAPSSRPRHSQTAKQRSPLAAGTIVLLMLFGAGVFWWSTGDHSPIQPASSEYVAVLLDSEDAVWSHHQHGIAYGTKFRSGDVVTLESGIVRIGFDSGAGVVLEGPAELEIQSNLSAHLRHGRLSALVPEEARGFRVNTSEVRIVDYGTRFGAVVDANGGAEVHVFEGEVGVEQSSKASTHETRLYANEARRFDSPEVAVIPTKPESFADAPTLEQLIVGRSGSYPPPSRKIPLSYSTVSEPVPESGPLDDALPRDILIGESFAYDVNQWRGQTGGVGFAESVWEADENFTKLIAPTKPLSRGRVNGGRRSVLLHGRDRACPSIANRIVRRLPEPIADDVYFSFLGRYSGLDDNDFFALWFDNNNSQDGSHSRTPNIGILRNEFIARFRVYPIVNTFVTRHQASLDTESGPVDGETFFLVGRLSKKDATHFNRLDLWINPEDGEGQQPHLTAQFDSESEPISSFQYIGVRIGQYTEVSDELLLDRFVFADTYAKVTQALVADETATAD